MTTYTRTQEGASTIWAKYEVPPENYVKDEIECTEQEYESGKSEMWGGTGVVLEITSAQAKIALRRAGLREKVQTAIDDSDGEVQDWFTDARVWRRDNPKILSIAKALKLSDKDVDDLFIVASKILD